ncbi:MAG: STAS domain-containing protein [Spirochaetaceae bacterium]
MEIETTESTNGTTVISLHGEMDLYSSYLVKQYVSEHLCQEKSPLIIDCRHLTYIDSSGVGVMLHAFAQSKKVGISVWFVNVHGSVRRVIELTSLLGFLPIVDSIAEAEALLS